LTGIKGVLLDLGGVVYIGDEPLPGAAEAIAALRNSGIAIRFLTNATRNPRRRILEKLQAMGVAAEADELFTPATAALRIIEEENLSPHLLIDPRLAEDFEGLTRGGKPAVVIGDAGEGFTYDAMNEAFRRLDAGAEFLALANNRSFRGSDGKLNLDAGAFVAALAFASRREPLVLGKPSPDYFAAALASMGCKADEAIMIGDDVESDVGGAMASGLTGILVKTGKYHEGAEKLIDPPPDHIAPTLAEAVEWILAQQAA